MAFQIIPGAGLDLSSGLAGGPGEAHRNVETFKMWMDMVMFSIEFAALTHPRGQIYGIPNRRWMTMWHSGIDWQRRAMVPLWGYEILWNKEFKILVAFRHEHRFKFRQTFPHSSALVMKLLSGTMNSMNHYIFQYKHIVYFSLPSRVFSVFDQPNAWRNKYGIAMTIPIDCPRPWCLTSLVPSSCAVAVWRGRGCWAAAGHWQHGGGDGFGDGDFCGAFLWMIQLK